VHGPYAAYFGHEILIEIEPHFCDTLRLNRPRWNVCQGDLAEFGGRPYKGTDLLAVGRTKASMPTAAFPARLFLSQASSSARTTSAICSPRSAPH
jgi:hypothetical protein